MPQTSLLERRNLAFGRGAQLFYKSPVHIVRGKGVYLYDDSGRQYIDMYNNVPCVGHANEHVVEAMHRQAQTLNVHSRYLHEGVVDYAERLIAKHAPSLNRVVFACTGTEANEIAIAVARAATGRRAIICMDRGYHGNSELVDKLTFAGERNDNDVYPVRFPDAYRAPEAGMIDSEITDYYLEDVRRAVADLESAGNPVACFILCPIFANEGGTKIANSYAPRAAEIIRDAGGLVISDEVQSGFCRTGQWWGYEAVGFNPDIATMGKPMGNGMPVSGTIADVELIEKFRAETDYFNTFASSPLQAAAGSAVLDVIEKEDLGAQATEVGEALVEQLQTIEHPSIGDVRGDGLFIGIEWVIDKHSKAPDAEGAQAIVDALKERGFLIGAAGAYDNVLKLRPPLVFEHQHAAAFIDAFRDLISKAQ
ncbi:MAG: aspartate aminotransferase family protein [Pseudomonadota bacterium]